MQLVRYHSREFGEKIALVAVGRRWIRAVMITPTSTVSPRVRVIGLPIAERARMEPLDRELILAIQAFQRAGAVLGITDRAAQLLDAAHTLIDPATPAALARQAH